MDGPHHQHMFFRILPMVVGPSKHPSGPKLVSLGGYLAICAAQFQTNRPYKLEVGMRYCEECFLHGCSPIRYSHDP